MIFNPQDSKITQLRPEETFHFACHPGVPCFTECCRELELALTPYDVLRLKNRLAMDSSAFLDRYVIVEREEGDAFPRLYLTMVDDGRASCVFVAKNGCTVYSDRPGACRAYPLGRGIRRQKTGGVSETYILVHESHCRGFENSEVHTATAYMADQELAAYNRYNDLLVPILQHDKIKQGYVPTKDEVNRFLLFLYDLDAFRTRLVTSNHIPDSTYGLDETRALAGDDEKLLELGIRLLYRQLFGAGD